MIHPGNAWRLGALLLTGTWSAAADPMVVSIGYRAPGECPDRTWFLGEVLERLSHVRVVGEGQGEGERRFDVEVESLSDESRARLTFIDADSQRVEREISARDCDEAVSGIALITALAIDPRLSIAASRRESEPEPADVVDPVIDPPTIETRPSADAAPAPDRAPVSKPREDRWYWGVGAALGAVSDVAPSWAPNGLVYAETGPARFRARLAVGYADSTELDLSGRGARFRLAHGRTEICPLAARLGAIVLRPCTALELGWQHAAGAASPEIVLAKSSSGLWFAGLGALRAELALGRAFALALDGQLRLPFLRRSYIFERPEVDAFTTPNYGGGVLVGAEARLE